MLDVFQHDIEQSGLAGRFVIRARRLCHVPRTVKLVTLHKVLPALFSVLYGEICIEIAVLVLRRRDKLYQAVYRLFKLGVGICRERVRRRLYPLCRVAVLENHAVKTVSNIFAAHRLARVYKVLHDMAFLSARDIIAQNIILIRDNGLAYQPLIPADKAVCFI